MSKLRFRDSMPCSRSHNQKLAEAEGCVTRGQDWRTRKAGMRLY